MAGSDDQFAQHHRTWIGFTRLMVMCMVAIAIILILMAVFLV